MLLRLLRAWARLRRLAEQAEAFKPEAPAVPRFPFEGDVQGSDGDGG
jgi:hypothetical protein